MLFNSFEFIFGLLPASVVVYFVAARFSHRLAIHWLVAVSFFFYAWWRPVDLPVFAGSILFNYLIGRVLNGDAPQAARRRVLAAGVVVDLLLLGFYKYGHFFAGNLASLAGRP